MLVCPCCAPSTEVEVSRNGHLVEVEPPKPPAAKRGSRLPDGWYPDQSVIDAMKMQFPFLTKEWFINQHDQFTDYWKAKAGQGAIKIDWNATWRGWIRRAALEMPHTNGHGGTLTGTDAKVAGWQALKGNG